MYRKCARRQCQKKVEEQNCLGPKGTNKTGSFFLAPERRRNGPLRRPDIEGMSDLTRREEEHLLIGPSFDPNNPGDISRNLAATPSRISDGLPAQESWPKKTIGLYVSPE